MAKIFGTNHDLDIELTQKVLKPTSEWNEYQITITGANVEVQLNGTVVSKFDSAGELTRGYIGLQGENGLHEYRNFRIKELGKPIPSSKESD